MTMRTLALLFLLLPALAAAEPARHALNVGGRERAYYLEGHAAAEAPAVLVLHGAGGNGPQALSVYRWDAAAARHGFLAIGLEALPHDPTRPPAFLANPRYWRDGSGRASLGVPVDDVAYVAAVLDDLAGRFDARRAYVTGFSSGAAMTFALAAALPDRFAAMAPVGGFPPHALDLKPVHSPSLFYITGAVDPLNPVAGGNVSTPWGGFWKPPSAAITAHWAAAMGCRPPVARDAAPDLHELNWPGCAGNRELRSLVIDGLGHEWSGGRKSGLAERWVGPYRETPDTTALIWDFFRLHRRD
jgi:polyhydroxybutyrate depolymerase